MSPPCFFTTDCHDFSVFDLIMCPFDFLPLRPDFSWALDNGFRKSASIMSSPYPMIPRGDTDRPGPLIRNALPLLCTTTFGWLSCGWYQDFAHFSRPEWSGTL